MRYLGAALVVLSAVLVADLASALVFGVRGPTNDEGTQAHVFQLALALMAPTLVAYLAAWDRRPRTLWPVGVAFVIAIVSVALVYSLEHP